MKRETKPSVGKLLRVLVAGGVTLAGTAGPLAATADDAPEKTGKTAEKAGATQSPPDAAAAKKKGASTDKEKDKDKEKKAEEAGGVKGW